MDAHAIEFTYCLTRRNLTIVSLKQQNNVILAYGDFTMASCQTRDCYVEPRKAFVSR